jgi:hypothetical protein
MQFDLQPCPHQLNRPPDLVTDAEGVSYLVFESILCGCQISLRLDSQGEIDCEFILPLRGSALKVLGVPPNSARVSFTCLAHRLKISRQ